MFNLYEYLLYQNFNVYNVEVNFILYDNNSKISNNQKNINIIVFNNDINLNFLENMII